MQRILSFRLEYRRSHLKFLKLALRKLSKLNRTIGKCCPTAFIRMHWDACGFMPRLNGKTHIRNWLIICLQESQRVEQKLQLPSAGNNILFFSCGNFNVIGIGGKMLRAIPWQNPRSTKEFTFSNPSFGFLWGFPISHNVLLTGFKVFLSNSFFSA